MYTVKDYVRNGAPSFNYGYGDLATAIASGVIGLTQVGAAIYGGVLQQRLAVQQYRSERQQYNEQQQQQQAMIDELQNQQTITEIPAGQTGGIMTTGTTGGISTKTLMIGGAVVGSLVLTILLLKR